MVFDSLDRSILLRINGLAQHSLVFDKTVVLLNVEGLLQGGFFFIFLWWLWFRDPDRATEDRIDVVRIAVAVCFAVVVARALQLLLPIRLRPIDDPTLPFVVPFTQQRNVLEHWSSFPSDHAVVYFALATAIWARYRWLGCVAYLWITVFGLLPRVYAGLHYPSDIVSGAALGTIIMLLADAMPAPGWMTALARRMFFLERNHAAPFYCCAVIITFEFMSLFDEVRLIGRGLAKALF